MKILVDENIPLMTVKDLKNLGHDVRDIRGSSNEGLLDTEIWKMAQKTESLLITTDKGFAQHREQAPLGHIDCSSTAAKPSPDS